MPYPDLNSDWVGFSPRRAIFLRHLGVLLAILVVERPRGVQTGPPRLPGAILAPGKSYSPRRVGLDDGGMAGVEGCRMRTPLAVA